MDMKLELVPIPVTDVDRAKAFYVDRSASTPTTTTGSARPSASCSSPRPGRPARSAFGEGITECEPGSVKGLQVVVADIEEARAELTGRGARSARSTTRPWGRFLYFATPTATAGRSSRSSSPTWS